VLALLPAEAAVQLRAEAAVELPWRAEAAAVELAPCAEAAELPRRAEAAAVELAPCAEAAAVELPRCAEAAAVELPRRAEAAQYPRCPVTARQEACDRRDASQCWLRGRLLCP
jgi:hypothetical protein